MLLREGPAKPGYWNSQAFIDMHLFIIRITGYSHGKGPKRIIKPNSEVTHRGIKHMILALLAPGSNQMSYGTLPGIPKYGSQGTTHLPWKAAFWPPLKLWNIFNSQIFHCMHILRFQNVILHFPFLKQYQQQQKLNNLKKNYILSRLKNSKSAFLDFTGGWMKRIERGHAVDFYFLPLAFQLML